MSSPPRHTAQVRLPLPESLEPSDALERLRGGHAPWLLESALRGPLGRFSFAGVDPYLVLRSRGSEVEATCLRAVHEGLEVGVEWETNPALEALRRRLPSVPREQDTVVLVDGDGVLLRSRAMFAIAPVLLNVPRAAAE